jgi:hypothetical protein
MYDKWTNERRKAIFEAKLAYVRQADDAARSEEERHATYCDRVATIYGNVFTRIDGDLMEASVRKDLPRMRGLRRLSLHYQRKADLWCLKARAANKALDGRTTRDGRGYLYQYSVDGFEERTLEQPDVEGLREDDFNRMMEAYREQQPGDLMN